MTFSPCSMKSMLSGLSLMTIASLLSIDMSSVSGQMYMHNPRGSNNRVNEQTTTATTATRLFNSKNNLRGGYNVGDRIVTAFAANAPYVNKAGTNIRDLVKLYNADDTTTAGQYDMQYIEGSKLQVQWMNQHGCGGDITDVSTVNCELILQYACQTQPDGQGLEAVQKPAPVVPGGESLLNGGNTNRINFPANTNIGGIPTLAAQNTAALVGRHESEQSYLECSKRSRNLNLFTGSAAMGQFATSTRQTPTPSQFGLECPEERDYYPYWSPSMWKDMAILTDHAATTCVAGKFTYASQNDHATFKCVPAAGTPAGATWDAQVKPITQGECVAAGGSWTGYTHGMPAPDCLPAPWSADNHLGNGVDGKPLSYDWTVPSLAALERSGAYMFAGAGTDKFAKCVMRFRYNVTLDEFDPYSVSAANNTSPTIITTAGENPTVNIGGTGAAAVNVQVNVRNAGLSTTYEDRSHTFYIRSRPAQFDAATQIVNLNTRGKRCNIVQCSPAVEYDFAPNSLTISPETFVHIQWTGSNTHNNNAGPAALDDGQDGNAGEGAANTDRQNIAQILDNAANFPLPLDKFPANMWTQSRCYRSNGMDLRGTTGANANQAVGGSNDAATECALHVTTSGQLRTLAQAQASNDDTFSVTLDTAPASLIGGVVMQFQGVKADTTYNYISTRNNNFTNRGQKGILRVTPGLASTRMTS